MKAEPHIFKAIDIRGIYGKDINEDIMKEIGLVLGNYLNRKEIVVSSDVRISSQSLRQALTEGLLMAGLDVLDIGEAPVGVATFFGWKTKRPTAYVTASHLPKEWNGVKFFHENGKIFHEDENREIKRSFFSNSTTKNSKGKIITTDKRKIFQEYSTFIKQKIHFQKKISVAFDFGNGAMALLKDIIRELPIEPIFIYDTPDGTFPNRESNPQSSDLSELKKAMKTCDIGFAFDGDGDRMVVLDDKGRVASTEQYTIIILKKLFKEQKGDVIANVECSNIIEKFAKKNKREVHRVKVGHTFMTDGVDKHKACFGVEKSGHCYIPYAAEFHDVLPVALYTASIVSEDAKKVSSIIDEIPKTYFEREAFECEYSIKENVMSNLRKSITEEFENIDTMDGIRVDFDDGWVLIRSSNTEPVIRLSVETQKSERTQELKRIFSEKLKSSINSFS